MKSFKPHFIYDYFLPGFLPGQVVVNPMRKPSTGKAADAGADIEGEFDLEIGDTVFYIAQAKASRLEQVTQQATTQEQMKDFERAKTQDATDDTDPDIIKPQVADLEKQAAKLQLQLAEIDLAASLGVAGKDDLVKELGHVIKDLGEAKKKLADTERATRDASITDEDGPTLIRPGKVNSLGTQGRTKRGAKTGARSPKPVSKFGAKSPRALKKGATIGSGHQWQLQMAFREQMALRDLHTSSAMNSPFYSNTHDSEMASTPNQSFSKDDLPKKDAADEWKHKVFEPRLKVVTVKGTKCWQMADSGTPENAHRDLTRQEYNELSIDGLAQRPEMMTLLDEEMRPKVQQVISKFRKSRHVVINASETPKPGDALRLLIRQLRRVRGTPLLATVVRPLHPHYLFYGLVSVLRRMHTNIVKSWKCCSN